jgi:hypothetical protein
MPAVRHAGEGGREVGVIKPKSAGHRNRNRNPNRDRNRKRGRDRNQRARRRGASRSIQETNRPRTRRKLGRAAFG